MFSLGTDVFGWDAFGKEFEGFYYTNGCKAGTYTYKNGKWSYKP